MKRSVIIDGSVIYTNYSQIMGQRKFESLLKDFIEILKKKNSPLLETLNPFKVGNEIDLHRLVEYLHLLTMRNIKELSNIINYVNPKELARFIESFYSFWRSKHRFMVRKERYVEDYNRRASIEYTMTMIGDQFKAVVKNLYRQLISNVTNEFPNVMRQLPSGAQVMFLVDDVENEKFKDYQWMHNIPTIWGAIFDPPAIFYTKSNKRRGIIPIVEKNILDRISLDPREWYRFPIMVGDLLFYNFVHREYLAHGAGLANLFEIATPKIVKNTKPEGIVIFGIKPEDIPDYDERWKNAVVFKDNNFYVGVIPGTKENDYFGYMKKTTLTVHNLIRISQNRLPIHGSMARITLQSGKSAVAMFIGDSGAGKSETLDALNRLDEVAEVDIIIDDMGSLDIVNGQIVAYGTETGAFVRLDDLPPGYAYHTMDRSIFMNPDKINARVIVPFNNYTDVITPTPIDFFLYANNYTEVSNDEDRIKFFNSPQEALEVFSEGKRMAKGTTAEVGITTSYFANPFGAVQMRKKHHEIAKKFIEKMFETGIKVGEIRTMLGIAGYEKDGTLLAAKALLKLIEKKGG
ncbi:phosphoenolpyruvate carboxykinase (ATP) [Thermosipho ferrireducens]|uniref:phosphoenolpyruvate carboxykinase (ATP) n=1 Tax=Thermosipho ferrireducens TaxID=2571116 RepID=A0ABX7S748_9BACT|nr:phosphoenolpyruvate carboxykinase (ATP) [Thermosipho ferrireducens]QTA37733.1 phosphoenolpyruvate carboxykinase (ATP) [Thermosipho ferrireducens]